MIELLVLGFVVGFLVGIFLYPIMKGDSE